jgi:hypothetical protein
MQAAEEYAGQTVECPDCKARTTIPASGESAAPPAPATPTAEAISADPLITAPSAAPAAKADAITTPAHARSTKQAAGQSRDDEDDIQDGGQPRRRDRSDTAVATGVSVGVIVLLVVGIGGCVVVSVGAILIALLVPAVQKVSEAAARTQTMNNMKQIGLACLNHHEMFKEFPSPQMKPMQFGMKPPDLSWRVTILPSVEQNVLFSRFDKSSGWDHPNNAALLNQCPKLYEHVSRPPTPTQTTFQYFTGPATMFPNPQSCPRLADITDGSANTFLFAEALTAVPWSKPADMAVTANGPLPLPEDRFLAAMADGSVRMINRRGVNDQVLRLLIDPRDGQPLPGDWDR